MLTRKSSWCWCDRLTTALNLIQSQNDRPTRYLYEQILLKTEERAYHIAPFLAHGTLVVLH
ncbi:MAG: hypothetical protein RBJ76_23135 [Stenomitos frigidus ULC029]